MACLPSSQLFDSDRPDYTNNTVFTSNPGSVTSVNATGLTGNETLNILYSSSPNGPFTQYTIDGQNVLLNAQNPSIIVEDGYWYKLVPSVGMSGVQAYVETDEDSNLATSVKAWMVSGSDFIPVEIVRYANMDQPVIYNLADNTRIINPTGRFTFDRETHLRFQNSNRYQNATIPVATPSTHAITIEGTVTVQNLSPTPVLLKFRNGTSGVYSSPIRLLENVTITLPTAGSSQMTIEPEVPLETYDVSVWGHSLYWRA